MSNEKTEALKGKVAQKLFQFRFTISNKTIDAEWEFQSPKQPYLEEAAQILQACKEAGLKFVPELWELPDNPINKTYQPTETSAKKELLAFNKGWIEAQHKSVMYIDSQIKEIDNE